MHTWSYSAVIKEPKDWDESDITDAEIARMRAVDARKLIIFNSGNNGFLDSSLYKRIVSQNPHLTDSGILEASLPEQPSVVLERSGRPFPIWRKTHERNYNTDIGFVGAAKVKGGQGEANFIATVLCLDSTEVKVRITPQARDNGDGLGSSSL